MAGSGHVLADVRHVLPGGRRMLAGDSYILRVLCVL